MRDWSSDVCSSDLHISGINGVGCLEETVRKSGFSVVDVGDYAEVSYVVSVIRTHELMVAYGILTQQASGVNSTLLICQLRPSANCRTLKVIEEKTSSARRILSRADMIDNTSRCE